MEGSGKTYAIEFFNNAFTTYTLSDDEAFRLKVYASSEHAWEEESRTEPTCTEAGRMLFRCAACGETREKIRGAAGHDWEDWIVTRQPTAATNGEKRRVCRKDASHVEIEAIPATGEKTVSGTLLAKMISKGSNRLEISYNKIKGADGYDIFFAKCNKTIKCKRVKSVKGNKAVAWTRKGLKKKTSYKAIVKAYVMKNGKKVYVKSSPKVHAYTSGGSKKYSNPKSITAKKTDLTLKKGKTAAIKAKVNLLQKGKKLIPSSHVATLRYLSSNPKIATVNHRGKVTAKAKGKCKVYIYAANGVRKTIAVTVK